MAQISGMRLLPGAGLGSLSPEQGKALVLGAGLQELDSYPLGQEEHTLHSFTQRRVLLVM